jgi:nucleoside 2-deoxyribosyltransferase
MILRGLLERSLGGFVCIRGFARLSDLAKISIPNDQYQRDLVPRHKADLEKYLDARENVFFPEVIMSYTLSEIRDNIVISGTAEMLGATDSKNKIIKIKQFNKSYVSAIDRRQKELVRIVTLEVDDFLGMGLFHRIDGNHRLSAAENVDDDKVNIQAPFCLILLNDNDADAKQQSVIFHNINSKGLTLTSEENLKAILDNNKFSDEELAHNFGWTYLQAKNLVPEIDKDYLGALNHVFSTRLRTVLLKGLEFLAKHGLITETSSIKFIKQKLTVVNDFFKQEPRLQACQEIGLLVAFLYYAFKDEANEMVLTSAFKGWILRNHIDEIKDIDAVSIVDVFNRVHASQIKIFMAMPYYSDEGVDAYNKALSNAVSSIKQGNPHLNLMSHPIMRTRSPTHDIITDILNKIQNSDIFIADITDNNPNVLYEYGFARGQNKNCILLRKKSTEQAVKSDYANDLRFHFEGDYDLESNLKIQIEYVLLAQGFEVR